MTVDIHKCRIVLFGSSPVPSFESIAGSLEQIALHDDPIGCVHIEFKLGIIVGKILQMEHVKKNIEVWLSFIE